MADEIEWYFYPETGRWYHIKIDMKNKKLIIDGVEFKYGK